MFLFAVDCGSNPIQKLCCYIIIWRSDNKTLDVYIEVVFIICRSHGIIKLIVVSYSKCLFTSSSSIKTGWRRLP